jgi:Calcineurin-like phosphoesterase
MSLRRKSLCGRARLLPCALAAMLAVLAALTASGCGSGSSQQPPASAQPSPSAASASASTSPQATGTGGAPLTIAVWGDTRPATPFTTAASDAFAHVASDLARRSYSLSLGLGDYAFLAGWDSARRINAKYDAFFAAAKPLLKAPAYYVPGNHELLSDATARQAYNERFHPAPDWYELDRSSLRILLLSTSEPGHEGTLGYYGEGSPDNTPQAVWLVERLKAIAAQDPRAWVIVVLHYPLHDPKPEDPWASSEERARLDALLGKYGVDLVLQGHVHNYRRHLAPDGITYLTQGTGGAPPKGETYPPRDGYDRAAFGDAYGYTLLSLAPDGALSGVTYAATAPNWQFMERDHFALTDRAAQ